PPRRRLRGGRGWRGRAPPPPGPALAPRASGGGPPRPGPAPVAPHSEFEPVAAARALPWSAVEPGDAPAGSGRIEVSQSGRWERWADVDGDPSFPEAGARAAAGPPTDVAWRKVVVPENYGFDE